MTLSAVTLFCEDIREEKSGADTLIGVFPDNVQIPQVPGAFPKLGIYTRIVAVVDAPPERFEIALEHLDGSEQILASFDATFVRKASDDARALGAPVVGFISKAVAAPFPIAIAGRLLLKVRTPTEEIISGNLNIKVREPTTASPTVRG